MKELDLLKKNWQNDDHSFNQVSDLEIYKMLHKKSSSIVKWIFIISVGELLFWIISSFLMKNSDVIADFKSYDKYNVLTLSEIISYIIILVFIYLFYKNYKKIDTSNSVKELISRILKTRKTVQNYVKVIIIYTTVMTVVMLFIQFNFDKNIISLNQQMTKQGNEMLFYAIVIIIYMVTIAIIAALIWLFYRLVYGILLKRLYKNYEELKKIDL